MKKNTVLEGCYKYFRIVYEDGTYKPREECMFDNSSSASDGDDTSPDIPVTDEPGVESSPAEK